MLHVADIETSIRFYQLLGFTVIDTDRCEPLGWARLHCKGGAVMFLRAEEPLNPKAQSTLLYMYTPNLDGLCDHLTTNGVKVPPISRPPYMPSGELRLSDPDGYTVLVAHWGDAEQQAWERRLAEAQTA